MISEALAALVPPALGVMVKAAGLLLMTESTLLMVVVVTKAVSSIRDVPVARPTTVHANGTVLSVSSNWPGSSVETWKVT